MGGRGRETELGEGVKGSPGAKPESSRDQRDDWKDIFWMTAMTKMVKSHIKSVDR